MVEVAGKKVAEDMLRLIGTIVLTDGVSVTHRWGTVVLEKGFNNKREQAFACASIINLRNALYAAVGKTARQESLPCIGGNRKGWVDSKLGLTAEEVYPIIKAGIMEYATAVANEY